MSAAPRHCADAQGREAGSRATASVADIACRGDLSVLLTEFYRRAFADDLLGNVFVGVARLGLAAHLPLICDFWETVQFRTGAYWRNAVRPCQQPHVRAGLTPAHFDWRLSLWTATVDARYRGANAELAQVQAGRIAGAMSRRITGADPAPSAAGHPGSLAHPPVG